MSFEIWDIYVTKTADEDSTYTPKEEIIKAIIFHIRVNC